MLEKILSIGAWVGLVLFLLWGAVSMSRAPRSRVPLYDKIMLWYSVGIVVLIASFVFFMWR